MYWDSDGFTLVGQRALDRLFDPPRGISAQLRLFRWIETLDCLGQSDVSLGNQIKQRQTQIGVIVGDGDNEPQIRIDHSLARDCIAFLNFPCELDLLLPR
jgi:hypothetical protein